MRIFSGICLSVVALLGYACVPPPDLPDERRISIGDVAKRVRCEIYNSTRKYKPRSNHTSDNLAIFVSTLAISFDLTLQVKDTDGISASAPGTAAWGIPITLGLFSVKPSGGLQGVARRTGNFKASFYLAEIWDYGDKSCIETEVRGSTSIRLDGHFGIDEWLDRVIGTAAQDPETIHHFMTTGTTLEFFLTPSAGVSTSWSIANSTGHKFDAAIPLSIQREYNNKLDIAITPRTDLGPPKVQLVCVLNMEKAESCMGKKGRDSCKGKGHNVQGIAQRPSGPKYPTAIG